MLQSEEIQLKGPPVDGSLNLCFRRYRYSRDSSAQSSKRRVALIMLHNVGTVKEVWEPVVFELFAHQSSVKSEVVVEEVWCMDSPNHGKSAVLNERHFLGHPEGISAFVWGRGIQTLLTSNLIGPKEVIPVGHSAGACVVILSTYGYTLKNLPFTSMILVEPSMMSREIYETTFKNSPNLLKDVTQAVKTKKDVWSSKQCAQDWFSRRTPWKKWDRRALDMYIEYGLRPLPTAIYPDKLEGYTLACTRDQECAGLVYHHNGFDGLERLSELCPILPVHTILGSKIDLVFDETHRSICDANAGRQMASVTVIQAAGHLVVQERPSSVAQAIVEAVNYRSADRARL